MNRNFLSTFPRHGEVLLITLFHLLYILFLVPFKIHYDQVKQKYVLEINRLRQIVSYIRTFLQIAILVLFCRPRSESGQPRVEKGPMSIFSLGLVLGYRITALLYLYTSLSRKTQGIILKMCNLIHHENQPQRQLIPDSNKNSLNIQKSIVTLHTFVFVILFTSVRVYYDLSLNQLEFELQRLWYQNILGEKPPLPQQGNAAPKIEDDFTLWKKAVSFVFMLGRIDEYVIIQSATALLFMTAKTLKLSSHHFAKCLRDSRNFCVIGSDEIFASYCKIRRLFNLASEAFGWICLTLILSEAINASICVVWVFQDTGGSAIYKYQILIEMVYISWFFCYAANASKQLNYISQKLNCIWSKNQRESSSLHKLIAIHEIRSGSIGLSALDIFTLSYGFVASITIGLLSNSTIVLQSGSVLTRQRPPPSPRPVMTNTTTG